MVLGDGLIDADGVAHKMAGLLPVTTSFQKPKLHLGYRQTTLENDAPIGPKGLRFKGHEFHYASVLHADDHPRLFQAIDARGDNLQSIGCVSGKTAGSFIHLIDQF